MCVAMITGSRPRITGYIPFIYIYIYTYDVTYVYNQLRMISSFKNC